MYCVNKIIKLIKHELGYFDVELCDSDTNNKIILEDMKSEYFGNCIRNSIVSNSLIKASYWETNEEYEDFTYIILLFRLHKIKFTLGKGNFDYIILDKIIINECLNNMIFDVELLSENNMGILFKNYDSTADIHWEKRRKLRNKLSRIHFYDINEQNILDTTFSRIYGEDKDAYYDSDNDKNEF